MCATVVGCYGKVKDAYNVRTMERVAVKIMKQARLRKIRGGAAAVEREIQVLTLIRGLPHVLQLIEHFTDPVKQKLYVITQFCDGTSLASLLEKSPTHTLSVNQTIQLIHTKIVVVFFSLG